MYDIDVEDHKLKVECYLARGIYTLLTLLVPSSVLTIFYLSVLSIIIAVYMSTADGLAISVFALPIGLLAMYLALSLSFEKKYPKVKGIDKYPKFHYNDYLLILIPLYLAFLAWVLNVVFLVVPLSMYFFGVLMFAPERLEVPSVRWVVLGMCVLICIPGLLLQELIITALALPSIMGFLFWMACRVIVNGLYNTYPIFADKSIGMGTHFFAYNRRVTIWISCLLF